MTSRGEIQGKGDDFRVLSNGTVVIDRGPMLMSIFASARGAPNIKLAGEGGKRALEVLGVLASHRHIITQYIDKIPSFDSLPPLIKKMAVAVRKFGNVRATPLIAVAGAAADEVADFIDSIGQTEKVIVNNGGDLSVRLRGDEKVSVGIKSDITERGISHILSFTYKDGIGGIATSGFGGRSFTTGIANAATVVAKDAMTADVAATLIGNATDMESCRVERTLAGKLYHSSDIPDLMITTKIGDLSLSEIEEALDRGMRMAEAFQREGLINGAFIAVKNQTRFSRSIESILQPVSDLAAV